MRSKEASRQSRDFGQEQIRDCPVRRSGKAAVVCLDLNCLEILKGDSISLLALRIYSISSRHSLLLTLMKRVRLDTWVCQLQPPRSPRLRQTCLFSQQILSQDAASTRSQTLGMRSLHRVSHRRAYATSKRRSATAAAVVEETPANSTPLPARSARTKTKSPPKATQSLKIDGNSRIARLSALHARLTLSPRLPLHTLARCLIDPSADSHPGRNNASLALLGRDLLAYYTTEHLMVNYPRLPLPILYAAQYAYSGPAVLSSMRSEWGVQLASAPGTEVDRALLQFKRRPAGNALSEDGVRQIKDVRKDSDNRESVNRGDRENKSWALKVESVNRGDRENRSWASKVVYDDEFGEVKLNIKEHIPYPGAPISGALTDAQSAKEQPQANTDAGDENPAQPHALDTAVNANMNTGVTAEEAGANFIRALAGALYLHAGDEAVKHFHREHILSRHLQLHKLFHFNAAPRDLNRLCDREGFESPVARLLSETGRLSRTPVFVVGVYSGQDKLGEAAGASLNEARVRAAAAALRSWYLYSPPIDNVMRPSDVVTPTAQTKKREFIPQMIDIGEVV